MPYFIVTIDYIKPIDVVELHTPAHREFLAGLQQRGLLLASGPFVPRTGGMLLMQAESLEQADAALDHDPFRQHEVARYQLREWAPKLGLERLQ